MDLELIELIPEQPVQRDGYKSNHALPLSSWTYHIKLILVETILFMGFELELYQPHEYSLIYSYLEYAFIVHNEQLQRVRHHADLVKKRKPKELLYMELLIMRNTAMENMSKAYTLLFLVLRAMNLIRLPTRDKTNDYMRYALRLKPFWGLSSPEILPFESFQELYSPPQTMDTILDCVQRAFNHLAKARQMMDALNKLDVEQTRMRYCFTEYKEDVKNLIKSCIGASIFLQGLVKQMPVEGAFSGKSVIVEYKYHPRFGVVKIIESKSRKS